MTAHPPDANDHDAVVAANAAFYDAFERRDLDAMAAVWERSPRASCVHPGWAMLVGWDQVGASWASLFGGPQQLQFIVTDERVEVSGDVAWVTCTENLIDSGAAHSVAATNVFVRAGDGWRLVHHQGSPVVQRPRRE